MSKALLKIEREAIRLPVKDREALAERLMRSVKQEPLTQVEEAWVEEAERRFSAWRRGRERGVPVERALLEKDKWGNWVINKAYNPAMLAQAVCKLEGFTYEPSDRVYWQQGHSTERDFIYVTTQNLSHDQLQALSDEVGEERSLLVMCSAFRGKPDKYPNLTIKKIPKTVLSRCE